MSAKTVVSRAARWGRATLVVGTLGVLVAAGSLFVAPKQADAVSFGCSWFSCSMSFNKQETNSIAIFGAAYAASKGVPWWIVPLIERAADYATSRGYCLKITYRPLMPMLGFTPGYYRC
jgi:hypothetical protein